MLALLIIFLILSAPLSAEEEQKVMVVCYDEKRPLKERFYFHPEIAKSNINDPHCHIVREDVRASQRRFVETFKPLYHLRLEMFPPVRAVEMTPQEKAIINHAIASEEARDERLALHERTCRKYGSIEELNTDREELKVKMRADPGRALDNVVDKLYTTIRCVMELKQ